MPSYDYRCEPCDVRFEVTRPIGDATEVRCPDCDLPAKRVFTPVGVVFKGSGFHNTDYRTQPAERPSDAKPATGSCPAAGEKSACTSCPAAD